MEAKPLEQRTQLDARTKADIIFGSLQFLLAAGVTKIFYEIPQVINDLPPIVEAYADSATVAMCALSIDGLLRATQIFPTCQERYKEYMESVGRYNKNDDWSHYKW